MGMPLTTFFIDFKKYPNIQDKMENYIHPWDLPENLIDWNSYEMRKEGKQENGVLLIEDTYEGFSKKMEQLFETLNVEVEVFNNSLGIDGKEDNEELLSLENDIFELAYFSRRGRRVLSNKDLL